MCAGELILLYNASEHGEGGNAHRDPDEERKGGEARVSRCILCIDAVAQWQGEPKGNEDPDMADDDTLLELATDISQTELHPDGEQPKVT